MLPGRFDCSTTPHLTPDTRMCRFAFADTLLIILVMCITHTQPAHHTSRALCRPVSASHPAVRLSLAPTTPRLSVTAAPQ